MGCRREYWVRRLDFVIIIVFMVVDVRGLVVELLSEERVM